MEGKKLLALGLKKEFGSGESIDIWNDPWIIDQVPRGAIPRDTTNIPTMEQLKEPHGDQWNVLELQRFFDQMECARILKVKPGGSDSKSCYTWIHNANGVYSVKSGYWLWSISPLNQFRASEQRPNLSELYEAIWKIDVSLKIKHFLWRCLSSSLSVGQELHRRHIKDDASCPLCGYVSEDVNHLLFKCDLARDVWKQTAWGHDKEEPFESDSVAANIWDCLHHLNEEDSKIWPWLLWKIWKSRNDFVFQRKTITAAFVKARAETDANEWSEHTKTTRPEPPHPPISAVASPWMPPSHQYLKCNVDASWNETNDVCGVAWILRDHTGGVKLYGIKSYPRLHSSLDAEATTLVWATNCMWNMGYDKIIFESDCATMIKALQDPDLWPRLVPYTTDILGILGRKPWEIQFQHISRSRNKAADSLAKHALNFPIYFGSIDNFLPTWLQHSLDF